MKNAGRWILAQIGSGLLGYAAIESIKASVSPTNPYRDAILLAIWPLVIVAGTVIAVVWIRQSPPARDPEPPSIDPPRDERDVMMAWQRAGVEQERNRLHKAVDTAITWLFRRQNWSDLSHDGQYSEPAPRMWAKEKYGDLGVADLEYDPPAAVGSEPGFTPPDRGIEPAVDARVAEAVSAELRQGVEDAAAVPSHVVASESDTEPPSDWAGPFWKGQQITRCPYCDYRTTDREAFQSHLWRDHTEPPSDVEAERIYVEHPQPWAQVAFHYVGDNPPTHYLTGVPADPDHTLYATQTRVDELVKTGLYDYGRLSQRTDLGGEPWRTGPPEGAA